MPRTPRRVRPSKSGAVKLLAHKRMMRVAANVLSCPIGGCGKTAGIGMTPCGHVSCYDCVRRHETTHGATYAGHGRTACFQCKAPGQICAWARFDTAVSKLLPVPCKGCEGMFLPDDIKGHDAWCEAGAASVCPCGEQLRPPVVESMKRHVSRTGGGCAVICRAQFSRSGPAPLEPLAEDELETADYELLSAAIPCSVCNKTTSIDGTMYMALRASRTRANFDEAIRPSITAINVSEQLYWRGCNRWGPICGKCVVDLGAMDPNCGHPVPRNQLVFTKPMNGFSTLFHGSKTLPEPLPVVSQIQRAATFKLEVTQCGANAAMRQ